MAQTYGVPFVSEGFDSEADFAKWTPEQLNATDANQGVGMWQWYDDSGFEAINPNSTGSVGFKLPYRVNVEQSLVSPMIDASDKVTPTVGFQAYFYDLSYNNNNFGAALGIFFYIDARIEGEEQWETVLDASSFNNHHEPADVKGWYYLYSVLPDKYAGRKFQLRLRYRTMMYAAFDDMRVFVDDFYVGEKPRVEARNIAVTPEGTLQALNAGTPVALTVLNAGRDPLSDFDIWYQVADGERVTQRITDAIAPGEQQTFEFDTKADFSAPAAIYDIFTGIDAEGDMWLTNNTRAVTVDNELAALPYAPTFIGADGKANAEHWSNPTTPYGRWVALATTAGYGYWYANMSSRSGQNGLLYSRPIVFAAGRKVNLQVTAYTRYRNADAGVKTDVPGAVEVYYTPDKDLGQQAWTLISATDDINYDALTVSSVFTPTTDGPGYIVFKSASPLSDYNTTAYLALQDIVISEAHQYDLAVSSITSPSATQTEFGRYETVTANISNNGTQTASGANVVLAVDGQVIATEPLDDIQPGATISHTFARTANLLGFEHLVTVSLDWSDDLFDGNNSRTFRSRNKTWDNIALISIDAPASGRLTADEHVAITLENKGVTTLSALPLTLTVAGQESGKTITVDETVDADIAPGDVVTYTFDTPSDLLAEDVYTITVTSPLESDCDESDNTLTTKVSCSYRTVDAGVDAIAGPSGRVMSSAENIIVSVHNYGEADLYGVPVEATVSRDGTTIATVSGSVPEIAIGQSVEYTIPGAVDMHLGGNYEVTATTRLDNDADASNDALTDTLYAWIIDCGVASIISPTRDVAEGTTPITVLIRNYGDAPIDNIPVYFKLGSNPQAGLYESELASGQEAEYTFTSTYNFKQGRDYTLTAYTAHPDDMNADNDAATIDITPTDALAVITADGVSVETADGAIVVTTTADTDIAVYTTSGTAIASRRLSPGTVRIPLAAGLYLVRIGSGNAKIAIR